MFSFANTGGLSNERPAISSAGSMVHIWVTGLNGHLWLYRWNGSGWDSWRDLGLLPGSVSLVGAPAAVVKPGTSTTVVVARTSSAIYTAEWSDSTATLGSWTSRGAPPGGMAESPVVVGASVVPGGASFRIYQRNNASPSRLYENGPPLNLWTLAPSQSGGVDTLTNVTGAPGGVFLGTTPATGTHVVVPGNGQQANWRKWYDTVPTPTLKMSTPRVLRATHTRNGTTWGPAGCETTEPQYENSATVVPPGQAGCANGAAIFHPSTGLHGPNPAAISVNAASLECMDGSFSQSYSCSVDGLTIPRCDAPGGDLWDGATTGFTDYSGFSNDNMAEVWGRPPATPRLFALRQMGTTRTYVDPSKNFNRGVSVFFESTNCGSSWIFNSMIDTCDPAADCDEGCTVNRGTDRPQSAQGTSSGGFAYAVTPVLDEDPGNRLPIFRMNLQTPGATWSRVKDGSSNRLSFDKLNDPDIETCEMPSRPVVMGSRIFAMCVKANGSSPGNVHLVYLNETNSTVIKSISFSNTFEDWQQGLAWPVLSPITQIGDDSYLRMVWPRKLTNNGSRQQLRMKVIRVNTSGANDLGGVDISSISAGGSVIQPSFILPVETQGLNPELSMLTWLDTQTSDQSSGGEGANWGNVTYRGCVFRGIDPTCSPLTLSIHNGNDVSWPYSRYNALQKRPGDYHESAGYFHSASGKYRFLVHYIEPRTDRDLLRANWVEVEP